MDETTMIEGCLAWQRQGLKPSAAVVNATEDYLESQDAMATWLEKRCEEKENEKELVKHLWVSWKVWAERSGEWVGKECEFRDKLKGRFRCEKEESGKVAYGLKLRPQPEEPM